MQTHTRACRRVLTQLASVRQRLIDILLGLRRTGTTVRMTVERRRRAVALSNVGMSPCHRPGNDGFNGAIALSGGDSRPETPQHLRLSHDIDIDRRRKVPLQRRMPVLVQPELQVLAEIIPDDGGLCHVTGSPMRSAASHSLSMACRSGRMVTNSGSIPNRWAHRMRSRATAVREPESSAIVRMSLICRGV